MKTTILGYPRIGRKRELKKAVESYWSKKITLEELLEIGATIRAENWKLQSKIGIDLIPSNDFSFYDQILDMSLALGCIPKRYESLRNDSAYTKQDLYFAMARGIQKDGIDITAMEMTKWFNTNYHYIVPEFVKEQSFHLFSQKIVEEYKEALTYGIQSKPVIIGPVSFLLLGKEKEAGFDRINLLERLLPVYLEIIEELTKLGVDTIQFDEPYLSMDLGIKERNALTCTYSSIAEQFPKLKIMLASYFNDYGENLTTALSLPIHTLHLDLVNGPSQLNAIFESGKLNDNLHLSLGIVDGQNIWKNNYEDSLSTIQKAINKIGEERILIASSCSLLHCPYDLELETNEKHLPVYIKQWLAFSKQKLEELTTIKQLVLKENLTDNLPKFEENSRIARLKKTSTIIHDPQVQNRVNQLSENDAERSNSFSVRKMVQKKTLGLPLFPTTTIGSFPQTSDIRKWRSKFKKGDITQSEYDALIAKETEKTIKFQEQIGLDVLVHGEYERNDMVEYFGEKLDGFAFTNFGWVQSYGSRCVKPPIIYGDISRPTPMTLQWSQYAQSLTKKWVKGMLTGPVTILQWSFVRNDQPVSDTCNQIALAIRDEVNDLEEAGLKIIQIDEPAIREGLPLRKADWNNYLDWAITSFKISSSGVQDTTQIHTHMCYSEFNDIIADIARMDADVITIECSRSQMELLDAFLEYNYPNEIGPGVYDIHSPRVPSKVEMVALMQKAKQFVAVDQLWVNPDCGLKTRHWEETEKALIEMVSAAKELRQLENVPA